MGRGAGVAARQAPEREAWEPGFATQKLQGARWATLEPVPVGQPLVDVAAGRTVAFASLGDRYSDFVVMLSAPAIRRRGGRVRVYRLPRKRWPASPESLRRSLKLVETQPLVLLAAREPADAGDSLEAALEGLSPRIIVVGQDRGALRCREIDDENPAFTSDCYAPRLVAALVAGRTGPRDTQAITEIVRADGTRFRREFAALVRGATDSAERRERYIDIFLRGRLSAVEVSELLAGYLDEAESPARKAKRRFIRYLLGTITPGRFPALAI